MFRHRHRLFGRRSRRRFARVTLILVLALASAVAARSFKDEFAPRLSFSGATAAYAANPGMPAVEASITARVNQDLPLLEDLWDVGGGPAAGVTYVEAPKGIRAGAPLRVSVHGDRPDGWPLVGALVEVSWRLGANRYRDVAFTDARGNVTVTRDIPTDCRNQRCVVAVRIYKSGLRSMAYSTFTPR